MAWRAQHVETILRLNVERLKALKMLEEATVPLLSNGAHAKAGELKKDITSPRTEPSSEPSFWFKLIHGPMRALKPILISGLQKSLAFVVETTGGNSIQLARVHGHFLAGSKSARHKAFHCFSWLFLAFKAFWAEAFSPSGLGATTKAPSAACVRRPETTGRRRQV